MDDFRENTLEGHVQLCELRYRALEEKINHVESRITKMENQIYDLKTSMSSGFNEIRLLLEKQSNARTIQIIATFGTIAVAVIGLIGYIITH